MFVAHYSNTEIGAQTRARRIAEEIAASELRKQVAEARLQQQKLAFEKAEIKLEQRRCEFERAAEALPELARSRPRHSYRRIEARACRLFKCTPNEIVSGRRTRDIVFARQFIAYWTSRLTKISMPQIGRFMHRDHTTILHSKRIYVEKRKYMKRTLQPVR